MKYIILALLLILGVGLFLAPRLKIRSSQQSPENQSNTNSDIAVENFLFTNLPQLPQKFDRNKLAQITRGQSEAQVRSILGAPSDTGDNHVILQDAIRGTQLLPDDLYYLRYRYKDDVVIVLVFRKTSKILVDYVTKSWMIGKPEF